uniref:Wu:fc23c09 n=2 Tax=Seriola lalandi dorsalis TaxID=1841481 RepID=A0A3B4Y9X3_SERLL
MEALTLLLMFFTLPGYSHVLQPNTQIAALDKDHRSVLRDAFISAEERGNGENKAAESTERREEEQRSERVSPETNPVRMPVKKEKTVEERREDGLKGEEILDTNQGYETGSLTDGMTAETFSKSLILGEETKRGQHKVGDLDKEVVEEKSKDGQNLIPNSKKETHDESVMVKTMLSDNTKNWKIVKTVKSHNPGTQKEAKYNETDVKFQMEKWRQGMVEEERESRLVAGMNLHETRGDTPEDEKVITVKQEVAEKGGNRERAENSQKILTHAQNPPSTPPPPRHHNVPPPFPVTPTQVPPASSLPSTVYAKFTSQFFPPAVTIPNPSVSTAVPGEVRSVSLLEDLLIEVLESPGYDLKQNLLEVKASTDLKEEMDKNIWLKPAQKELQTTHDAQEANTVVQPESESAPKVQSSTPKPKEAKFITEDLNSKEPNPTPKSNENISTAKLVKLTHKPNMTQSTGKPKTVKLVENDSKLAGKRNKASLPKPQLTKPSAKPQLTTTKTLSTRPTKINRGRKNKTITKSKEKKRKKDNKTQKPKEKKEEVATPTHFPYFMDNYCPPECACYGRVVQCSDKGVDRVPYGIPYNARYILLMNNHIDSIQLDLLNEYVSMEFLVMSNNRLTDGTIEGAFEGVPALKRLYLDRNLLKSVPTDLPVSLEELRLDNNQLGVMSEAAWARCPGLLVLSLSNNSLGNGSESLPNAVLSPLCNLRTLNLDHNQLTSVPQGLPLSIKELYLKGNLIGQFRGGAFNGVSELLVLDLSANTLTNKGLLRESLLNATHLESLNLEGNRLKQVPRHLPRSLKTLNLEGNLILSIKKAAFSTLKNLEHLGLARNKIFKVAIGAFRTLPVLHQLDLCHNTLHQVPRQLPQGLHSVALSNNKIQSVPRDAFCWGDKSLTLSRLIRVQLEHNLIDMGKLDAQAFRCLRGFQVVHFY